MDMIGIDTCKFPSPSFLSMLISLPGRVDFARDKSYDSNGGKL